MNNNILVTGASGFVGCFLIDKLLLDSKNNITATYCKSPPIEHLNNKRINWIQFDLTADTNYLDILTGIEVVYHLAGYSSVHESETEKRILNAVNVMATKNLAQECVAFNITQFIFVSSIAACEMSDSIQIDELNGIPKTAYGWSKKRAEEVVIKVAHGNYHYTIFRPTALFGENHKGSVFQLTQLIANNRMVIFGCGCNMTNFYYIQDFVDVLLTAQYNPVAYNNIFIASDSSLSLVSLVHIIRKKLNKEKRVVRLPLWIGKIIALLFDWLSLATNRSYPFSKRRLAAMNRDVTYSNIKLFSKIEVEYRYGIEHGLNRTIQWYLDQKML